MLLFIKNKLVIDCITIIIITYYQKLKNINKKLKKINVYNSKNNKLFGVPKKKQFIDFVKK